MILDLNLFLKGTASVAKQTSFMVLLLDLVCIRDASDDPQERHMFVHGTVRSVCTTKGYFKMQELYVYCKLIV